MSFHRLMAAFAVALVRPHLPPAEKKGFALILNPAVWRCACLHPRAVPRQLAGGWPRGSACRSRARVPGNYSPWD